MNGAPSDSLSTPARPCWYCRWWAGPYARLHALCDRPNGKRVTALPRHGCAFFEREPGADDDGWEPPAMVADTIGTPGLVAPSVGAMR